MASHDTLTRKPFGSISPVKSAGSSFITDSSSGTSPIKKPLTGSSRVIESLHQEIDVLKDEQIKLKTQNQELKKSSELISKRRDELLEQLSNLKHENEMVNSLLQRKQRRINDLEESLSDITYKSDDMNIKLQSLETRCKKLSESEAKSTAEYERIKIAYDAIVVSHKEYRSHFETEIKQLKDKLAEFVEAREAQITKNLTLINKSDATIYRSIKSISLRSNEIEEKTEERHIKINETLDSMLAIAQEHSTTNQELFQTAKLFFDKFAEKLNIDKDEMIRQFNEQFKENQVDPQHFENTSSPDDTNINEIKVKKRGERVKPTTDQRSLSVEQRISSLTKDLNNVIPAKDRVASTPQIKRIQSMRRSSSKQGAEILADTPRSPQSPNTPRFQDNIQTDISPSKSSDPSNTLDISRSASAHNSSVIIESADQENEHGTNDEDADDAYPPDSAGKKKRRRRRRRKNKSKAGEGQEGQEGHDGENDEEE